MNRLVKQFCASFGSRLASSRLAALLPVFADGSPHLLRVLMYHRVDWPDARGDLSPATLSATPPDFAAQMECLAEHFHVVDLDQVCDAVRSGRRLPPWAVLLTFDDAYLDFRRHAWPVLKRLGLPVTVFVPTAFADQPERAFWWDRLYFAISGAPRETVVPTRWGAIRLGPHDDRPGLAARLIGRLSKIPHDQALDEVERISESLQAPPPRSAVMGWSDLKDLAREGVTLAPHTRTHPLMNRVPLDQARAEAVGSRDDLERHIGFAPPAFAYPGGGYNQGVVRMLAEEGFNLAFTTCRGTNHLHRCPPLQLRRINVGRRTTPDMLRVQLTLSAACLNPWWPLQSAA